MNSKKVVVQQRNGLTWQYYIREYYSEKSNIFLWPSALLLGAFLVSQPEICKNKQILEIGAGVGFPSIVTAQLGASKCIITEKSDDESLTVLNDNICLNNVADTCSIVSTSLVRWCESQMYVLGAFKLGHFLKRFALYL